jgi:FMN-dependent NADH-azoreductase
VELDLERRELPQVGLEVVVGSWTFRKAANLPPWFRNVCRSPGGTVTGLSVDPAPHEGLLGGRDLVVLAARGGGYAPGTPREGWDHAEQWLPHGLSYTGLEPRFITAELTLADANSAMAALKPLAAESLAAAERAIDGLWHAEAIAA